MALNMADILARARLAKEIKEIEEQRLPTPDRPKPAMAFTSTRTDLPTVTKPPATNVGISAIAALRERLKLAAAKESIRATEAGHTEGYLPADEMIEVSIEQVDTSKADIPAGTFKLPSAMIAGATTGMHGESITYNKEQQGFIDLIGTGEPCVLVGAAGTGKTTCSQGGIKALIASGKVPVMQADGHKHLVDGTIGIIIISYTRRAVNNIRKVQSTDLKSNCLTSHKLLEYAPEYYDIQDPTTGLSRRTMQFSPSRNASNPLSNTIHTIIVEEASMLSTELFSEISAALIHTPQWVFIGDIQQLPPVFGSAILGFKMLELPVIELIEVYRQALESPIIKLAHRILSGNPIPAAEYPSWKSKGKLTLHPWKKKLSADNAALTLAAFFKGAIDSGSYDVDNDMILIPYNKACGTIEINNQVANHLARKRNARTFEVMAGFNKHYFSIGDKVLYDREDAEIIDILPNPTYTGGRVQPSSRTLDYWGHNSSPDPSKFEGYGTGMDDVDFMLSQIASTEERVTQASHNIVVRLIDTAQELTVSKASEVNALLLAYALTVHKAQGSEWRKVFFCLHQSHATMMQRELLYTGVTRAREELYVICEPETFTKGILSQKIKGNTLKEKAEFFKGKLTR
jgi:exodeoxyribonuclease V alpha subunit